MSPFTAAIASTELRLLLRDEVFVDFFNVFLNLPVSLLCIMKAQELPEGPGNWEYATLRLENAGDLSTLILETEL